LALEQSQRAGFGLGLHRRRALRADEGSGKQCGSGNGGNKSHSKIPVLRGISEIAKASEHAIVNRFIAGGYLVSMNRGLIGPGLTSIALNPISAGQMSGKRVALAQ